MRIPNAERAVVEIAKIIDYALNPEHPVGKHKARVFRAALGLTTDDGLWLRDQLLRMVAEDDNAVAGRLDEYGQRYQLDFQLQVADGRSALVRSAWIILADEVDPRLTTVYVLEGES